MKYPIFILSLLVLFITLNTSCTQGNKYMKETQMLDSIQLLIIKADSGVKTIDSAKIEGYANHVMMDVQLLKMWHKDSMGSSAAEIFRDCNAIRWALMTDAGRRGPLLMELEKSQKQISHLVHDLHHNLVPKDSAAFYVSFETKKATELIQVSTMSVSDVSRQMPLYNALAPRADSLISLLQNHKNF